MNKNLFRKMLGASLIAMISINTVGCASGQAAEAQSSVKDTQKGSNQEGDLIELEFWYSWQDKVAENNQELTEKFNETVGKENNIRITAEYQGSYDELHTKLKSAFIANEQPAISVMEIASIKSFADAGMIEPLENYISDEKESNFLPGLMDNSYVEGKLYGVPYLRSTPIFYYNKTLFDQAGITSAPTNWEELPTGNFGNILAAYYAKQMGVPIAKLICASNENKVLFDFFQTGVYNRNREFVLTSSPSMDILISSNLERLIYTIAGQDAEKDTELMNELKEKGVYEITPEMKEKLADFRGGYATEEETAEMIHDTYKKTGYVMDTHTAVAAYVCKKYREESKDTKKCLVASTASPYKFARSVMTAIDPAYDAMDEFRLIDELNKVSGFPVPNAIEEIRNAEIRHTTECDADKMKETVKEILGI